MVGDVKQSIYRFRLARPELFMEKYHRYSLEDSEEQRIDLHKNFRSRGTVLSSVNYLFRQIMGEDLGGITYEDENALYTGASFPERADGKEPETEVLLIEKDGEELEEQGIKPNTIRLSIGTEHIDDIIADLKKGFAAGRCYYECITCAAGGKEGFGSGSQRRSRSRYSLQYHSCF